LQGIEQILSSEISDLFTFAFTTVGTLVVITVITPFFIIAMLPVTLGFAFIAIYYIQAARQLRKLDAQTRSTLYQHFTETLNGLTTIRGFEASREFITENENNIDNNHRAYWSLMVSNRWLGLHLEFVGSLVVFCAGLFVILYKYQLSGAGAGLALTYALSVTNTLNWLVRTIAEVDMGLSNVHRVKELEYLARDMTSKNDDHIQPPANWPSKGKIIVANLIIRYQPTAPVLLNEIGFESKAMEKIGIMGDKNSGKNALINALFRLCDFESGSIKIDNVDISQINPSQVRSLISIVPQQCLTFSGTIRENLDPYGQHQDYDIWGALRKVSIDELISEMLEKLDTQITSENMTLGQKYLLSFARILLKQGNKIIILDEIPVLDAATDALIQRTIRMQFTDCTVICLSSVLRNIIDYDRVMLLDKGKIVEFDSPANLLADPSTRFHVMCRHSGEFEQLKQLAGQKEYVLEELSASVQSAGSAELGSSFLRGHLFSPNKPSGSAGTYSSSLGGKFHRQLYMRSRSFVGSMVN